MGLIDLVWNVNQSKRLDDLKAEVGRLREHRRRIHDAEPIVAELAEVQTALGEMRLCLATIFRILQEKNLVTHEELSKLLREVDESDGRRDNSFDGESVV